MDVDKRPIIGLELPMPGETTSTMLAAEIAYYEQNLHQLLADYRERFVLIKGSELIGAFNTIEEALEAGASRFGLSNFLVRRVTEHQEQPSAPALFLGILHANSASPLRG
jgi:hypothetical protein